MKIAIGCDHGGFVYIKDIEKHLIELEYDVVNYGTYNSDSCDYNDYAIQVAKRVASGEHDLGILVCGTGIGMNIMANKVNGVRAALCGDTFSAKATREHNDSNVLCLGARVLTKEQALEIIDVWLSNEFSNEERHVRRVNKINNYKEV